MDEYNANDNRSTICLTQAKHQIAPQLQPRKRLATNLQSAIQPIDLLCIRIPFGPRSLFLLLARSPPADATMWINANANVLYLHFR